MKLSLVDFLFEAKFPSYQKEIIKNWIRVGADGSGQWKRIEGNYEIKRELFQIKNKPKGSFVLKYFVYINGKKLNSIKFKTADAARNFIEHGVKTNWKGSVSDKDLYI